MSSEKLYLELENELTDKDNIIYNANTLPFKIESWIHAINTENYTNFINFWNDELIIKADYAKYIIFDQYVQKLHKNFTNGMKELANKINILNETNNKIAEEIEILQIKTAELLRQYQNNSNEITESINNFTKMSSIENFTVEYPDFSAIKNSDIRMISTIKECEKKMLDMQNYINIENVKQININKLMEHVEIIANNEFGKMKTQNEKSRNICLKNYNKQIDNYLQLKKGFGEVKYIVGTNKQMDILKQHALAKFINIENIFDTIEMAYLDHQEIIENEFPKLPKENIVSIKNILLGIEHYCKHNNGKNKFDYLINNMISNLHTNTYIGYNNLSIINSIVDTINTSLISYSDEDMEKIIFENGITELCKDNISINQIDNQILRDKCRKFLEKIIHTRNEQLSKYKVKKENMKTSLCTEKYSEYSNKIICLENILEYYNNVLALVANENIIDCDNIYNYGYETIDTSEVSDRESEYDSFEHVQ